MDVHFLRQKLRPLLLPFKRLLFCKPAAADVVMKRRENLQPFNTFEECRYSQKHAASVGIL